MKSNLSSMFKSGTRGKLAGALWLLLTLGLLVAVVFPAAALADGDDGAPPLIPQAFYGYVTINGQQAPVGTLIEAFVNGVNMAGGTPYVDANGRYGDGNTFFVAGGSENGVPISFFVDGIFATTVEFHSGVATELDLAVTSQTYTLTVVSGGCCDITVSGGVQDAVAAGTTEEFTVESGTAVTLQTVATACCSFSGWKINDSTVLDTAAQLQLTVNDNVRVEAVCAELGPYTLTVISSGCCTINLSTGGSVAANQTGTFSLACGTGVTLTAAVNECCVAGGWALDGAAVQGNPITVTLNQDHEAVFTCTTAQYTVNVSAAPGGSGTVTGGGSYACGSTATLQADANPGWKFSEWSGDLSGSENPISFQVSGNMNVVANFVEDDLTIPGAIMGITLNQGWNTFSIPIKLDSSMDTWGEFKTLNELQVEIIYGYKYYEIDGEKVWLWVQQGDADFIHPLDGFYIKMQAEGRAQIVPSPNNSSPPVKTLMAGLNLVGVASLVDVDTDEYLFAVYNVPADSEFGNKGTTIGYTLVHNPPINPQDGWTNYVFLRDHTDVPLMKVGKAYWVNMMHEGELMGWTSTPLIP